MSADRDASAAVAANAGPPGAPLAHAYAPPFWLPGAHLQTIVPALRGWAIPVRYRRERWDTPDGDFIDLDWVDGARDAPRMVLFHGLEGSSCSRYALAMASAAQARGWSCAVVHFRSCSGELNRAPRFYHSGDSGEIDWVLRRLQEQRPDLALHAVGISLGGNALLKWLGERGSAAAAIVTSAAAISAPLDLQAGGRSLSSGINLIYTRMFLETLKPKSLQKLAQYPGLFDRAALLAARDLHAFDNIVTAPLHGYRDTDDYWTRASSKPVLGGITTPTLILNARNDPFMPGQALPDAADVSSTVRLETPAQGGHVGFHASRAAGGAHWLPQRVFSFFTAGY